MPKDFNYWKKQHDSEELKEFNYDKLGTLWLKVKSIVRRKYINTFTQVNKISLKNRKLTPQFKELYEILCLDPANSHKHLNTFIINQNSIELKKIDVEKLIQELYKVQNFKWGADNQNDLGKYLVKKYVKDNISYDFLTQQMEKSVLGTVQDYLICTWYNHWTSILIEHIFKSHNLVLPTVGKIKSVDFFINEIPFDLKVTHLPENFVAKQRKLAGLVKEELSVLKKAAKEAKIKFSNKDTNLYYSLYKQLGDIGGKSLEIVEEIKDFRLNLIDKIKKDPLILAKNLYEEQSDFRFGAENRIFLILVNRDNFEQSWELKRNIHSLKPTIHKYLDDFKKKRISDLELEFYKNDDPIKNPKKYQVLTDVIVIEK